MIRDLPDVLAVPHQAGELIFQEAAFAAGIHVVVQGVVVRGGYVSHAPRPVALARAGDLLGIEAWLGGEMPRYQGFARALTATSVLFLPTLRWREALAEPRFRELVLAKVAEEMLAREGLSLCRDQEEIALAWLILRWGEPKMGELCLPADIPLFAALIGASRHAIRQALGRLVDLGAVEIASGEIRGHPERLEAMREGMLTASPQ